MFQATDSFELIGGEIVPKPPVSRLHQVIAQRISIAWRNHISDDVILMSEQQLDLDEATYTVPDLLLWPSALLLPDAVGPDILLLIEIARTSQKHDLTFKAPLYARFGIREYWVIDANTLTTTVHTSPTDGVYQQRTDVGPTADLRPTLLPQLSLTLGDLAI